MLHVLLAYDGEGLISVDLKLASSLVDSLGYYADPESTRGGPTAIPTDATVESHEGTILVWK